jgi:hypothetical protein
MYEIFIDAKAHEAIMFGAQANLAAIVMDDSD